MKPLGNCAISAGIAAEDLHAVVCCGAAAVGS